MNDPEIAAFLERPYARVLVPDAESGTFAAQIAEFPGCVAEGPSPAVALSRLERAAASWLRAALDLGQPIPIPAAERTHSGRVLLRLSSSLHRRAADAAEADGTSLNQFIVAAVAERLGAVSAAECEGTSNVRAALPEGSRRGTRR